MPFFQFPTILKVNCFLFYFFNKILALICFQSTNDGFDECEVFTGSSVEPISSSLRTSYPHWGGQLGFYNGQPTTVSTFPNPPHASGYQKVETLTESGWIELEDQPM